MEANNVKLKHTMTIVWNGDLGNLMAERLKEWLRKEFPEVPAFSVEGVDGRKGTICLDYPYPYKLDELTKDVYAALADGYAQRRTTFTVPEGFEAVRDAEGRATGEVRPKARAADGDPESGGAS